VDGAPGEDLSRTFDVSSDGSRFLMIKEIGGVDARNIGAIHPRTELVRGAEAACRASKPHPHHCPFLRPSARRIRSTAAPRFYWGFVLSSPPLRPEGGGGSGGGGGGGENWSVDPFPARSGIRRAGRRDPEPGVQMKRLPRPTLREYPFAAGH
jgi:hypothetical protein